MYEGFFRYAVQYIYTFGQRLPFKIADCYISGDWLYRLQQLPWAKNAQFYQLDERMHEYAIQPAMVPCKVPISGFLWQLIEAVFGDTGMDAENTNEANETVKRKEREAEVLFDDIITQRNPLQAQFAISKTFVRELSEYCFYSKKKPSFCNYDLIEPGAPPERKRLRKQLKEHEDFVVIGSDEWARVKEEYGGIEIQMWQRNNIYGLPEGLE